MELSDLPLHLLVPAVVPLIAAATGWYGIYQPQHLRIRSAEAMYREEEKKTDVQRDVADREALIEAYQQRLTKTADTDWLIAQTALVATKANVQLTAVSPQRPVTEAAGYTRLSIIIECEITYHQLGELAAALENAQPFVRIDQVEVGQAKTDPKRGADPANRRKVTLTLSTIYLPAVSSS